MILQLQNESKKLIVDELRYVLQKMLDAKDVSQQLFYFSGANGIINRIFNLHDDDNLIFIHEIMQSAYNILNIRVNESLRGINPQIVLPKIVFQKLVTALQDLSTCINSDSDVIPALVQISKIAYVATGNGYYLLKKGTLKL